MISIFLLLLSTESVRAQSSIAAAELRGTITDPSGAVVATAEVRINNKDTGLTRTVETNDRGEYVFLSVPPGTYRVRIDMLGFAPELRNDIQLTVGQTMLLDFSLQLRPSAEIVNVTTEIPLLDSEHTQQSNTVDEKYVRNLPIDRRDYLTFSLLLPGTLDSKGMADNSDFRVVQTQDSGLSFYGSNGRGNSITVDGAEANNAVGGVRPTLGQEAVQEFEINRSNYSAELGGASGAVINIVSKSGTNQAHGSVFGFFRNQAMDAADPFAIVLVDDRAQRVKPGSTRQQYGATLGGPLKTDRTFLFGSLERLNRNESSAVTVLTDIGIFQPTPTQQALIDSLTSNPSSSPIACLGPLAGAAVSALAPKDCAGMLRSLLTSKTSTVDLFKTNSGVLPFTTDSNAFSIRADHRVTSATQLLLRYNYTKLKEGNPSTHALVGFSRSNHQELLDSTTVAAITHVFSPNAINETRIQWNYRDNFVLPNDTFGPEISIPGYGFFGRDYALPSYWWERRYEAATNFTFAKGAHRIKSGVNLLLRATKTDSLVFFGGRLSFGALPGALVSPLLQDNITALQAFDIGIPGFFQFAEGNARIGSTDPDLALYLQDTWNIGSITLDYGLRYEYDHRRPPLPTRHDNFAPRFGFSWRPRKSQTTVVRGGYGIFYSPIYYQIDWVVSALNEINGYRQIAQVLTTLNPSNPLAINGPVNIYRTLLSQGVIGIPSSGRGIGVADLSQFGISFAHTGPRSPLTVLFKADPNYRNSYSQQASFGIDHEFRPGTKVSVNYVFASTLHIPRSRDLNILPRPIGPLGIPDWTAATGCTGAGILQCFQDPLLFQNNVYESTARAFYHGITLEMQHQLGRNLRLEANYTLSKAIDEVTDFNSDFQPNDQTCLRCERALSGFDQRHKVVVYGYIQNPLENSSSLAGKVMGGIALTPIFRANSSRPFNLLAGIDVNGDRHSTTDRPPFAGRNTGIGPNFWTVDMRLTRELPLKSEKRKLELIFESFNLFNRLNFASVNNTVGPSFAPPFRVEARRDRNPSEPLGFTSAYDPRRIQLGARVSF